MAAQGAAAETKQKAEQALELEVHFKEEVSWAQLAHLRDWMPDTQRLSLIVPPAVTPSRVLDTIRLAGNCFPNLQHLQVAVRAGSWPVGQAIVSGAAELLGLSSISITGGMLAGDDLHLHVLTGLRNLNSLSFKCPTGAGLGDKQLIDGLASLTQLTELEFRGSLDDLTDEGMTSLTSLLQLRRLSVLPLGIEVTRVGLGALCTALPRLTSLTAGFSQSQQVDALQGLPDRVDSVGVVVSDPSVGVPGLLTTCALCLGTSLCSLRLNTVKVDDCAFLLALGSMTALECLSMAVAPAHITTPSFMLNLAVLAPLKRMRSLEIAVIGDKLLLPFNTKIASCLVDAWPELRTLSLSCMVPPQRLITGANNPPSIRSTGSNSSFTAQEDVSRGLTASMSFKSSPSGRWRGPLQPQALTLLSGFKKLQQLSLYAPLGDSNAELPAHDRNPDGNPDSTALRRVPFALTSLPPSLTSLMLERAELSVVPIRGDLLVHTEDSQPQPQQLQLPQLQSLELSLCEVSDQVMKELFHAANQLTRVELSEVRGISAASLRELSSLTRLTHLAVVDTHDGAGHASSGVADARSTTQTIETQGALQASATESQPRQQTWWEWLSGAPTATTNTPVTEELDKTEPTIDSKSAVAIKKPQACLYPSDVSCLAMLNTLRHLEWSVGPPLALPVPAPVKRTPSNANVAAATANADKPQFSPKQQKAIAAVKSVREVAHQLVDLHELYVECDAGMEQLQISAEQSALILDDDSKDIKHAKGKSLGENGADEEVDTVVPAWLSCTVNPGCLVSCALPISHHDAWTDQSYTSFL